MRAKPRLMSWGYMIIRSGKCKPPYELLLIVRLRVVTNLRSEQQHIIMPIKSGEFDCRKQQQSVCRSSISGWPQHPSIVSGWSINTVFPFRLQWSDLTRHSHYSKSQINSSLSVAPTILFHLLPNDKLRWIPNHNLSTLVGYPSKKSLNFFAGTLFENYS